MYKLIIVQLSLFLALFIIAMICRKRLKTQKCLVNQKSLNIKILISIIKRMSPPTIYKIQIHEVKGNPLEPEIGTYIIFSNIINNEKDIKENFTLEWMFLSNKKDNAAWVLLNGHRYYGFDDIRMEMSNHKKPSPYQISSILIEYINSKSSKK